MTKTIYFVAASVDGFIADAEGKLDWLTRFDGDAEIRSHYESFLSGVGALAMGAETYLFLLSHGGAWPYADRPTFVFTRRQLAIPAGADVRLVNGRVATARNAMLRAAGERDLWLVGGGKLAAQFAEIRAIDEIHLGVAPTVLGAGTALLPAALGPLALQETKRFAAGFVELRYACS